MTEDEVDGQNQFEKSKLSEKNGTEVVVAVVSELEVPKEPFIIIYDHAGLPNFSQQC